MRWIKSRSGRTTKDRLKTLLLSILSLAGDYASLVLFPLSRKIVSLVCYFVGFYECLYFYAFHGSIFVAFYFSFPQLLYPSLDTM